ncbi:isochorismate synthase MenF [Bacillus sp. B1-b2]|uniref:isochorismate synthase n=1 Tax=Bacillus sp. B1-b2 TaxID=2653201 RepID=UPI00126190F0|nr:isochorismate synthase [Bacillus sp. B1-b2]KAB7666825.1 isochorismate synthase [Bacillus sp. B1-b2]
MKDRRGMVQTLNRKDISSSVLVSKVKKLEDRIDCLDFFSQFQNYEGQRYFWKDPNGQNTIVGIGICEKIICPRNEDRYEYAQVKWNDMLKNAVINNEYVQSGIGPVLLGGFSFDPYKEKMNGWKDYSEGYFFIPSIMLSEVNGEQFVTTNILLPKNKLKEAQIELEKKNAEYRESSRKNRKIITNKLEELKELNVEQWKEAVYSVIKQLQEQTDLKKIVLAREAQLTFKNNINVEQVLNNLIQQQKNGYIFALELEDRCFLGATPERLVKKEKNTVFSVCLAGSIQRGEDLEEDRRLEQDLLHDPKNRSEHHFVVEMIKKAMNDVCEKVVIPDMPVVLKMRDIQHLFTPVTGKVKEKATLFSLIRLLHPTPALGGYPREQALAIIRDSEPLDRGLYGSPMGWLDYKGDGEFAVSIRSGLIEGRVANIFAGCGIVADSDVDMEYNETNIKFKPMISALGGNMK